MTRRWPLLLMGVALAIAGMLYLFPGSRTIQAKDSPFVAERSYADLQTIVGFGPRPAGSAAIETTRTYIVAQLRQAGLMPQLDEWVAMTPLGPRKMVNVRATRAGSKPGIIALSGHYDTKLFDFPFLGASDGGSSAAWLLEMARATAGLKLDHSLEFIFFDGEEAVVDWTDTDSTYGSRYDVERRRKDGTLGQLKALILVDMIGDKDLDIRRELTSTTWLTSLIWDTAHGLGYARQFLDSSLAVEDDHDPYLAAGIPAVDLIDFNYSPWHTAADTLDKMSGDSLKIVGDAVYFSLSEIDKRLQ